MKNFSNSDYLKSEYNKINNLFISGKFDIVIEKSNKTYKKKSYTNTFLQFFSIII